MVQPSTYYVLVFSLGLRRKITQIEVCTELVTNLQLGDNVTVNVKSLNDSDCYSHLYCANDLAYKQRKDQRNLRAGCRVSSSRELLSSVI